MTADFRAMDVGYEVQKSFANKFFSNKSVAKGLIDNHSATLLDNLYKLVKIYTKSKKEAEKIVKNIIKISVKIGMLERSDKFNSEEHKKLIQIQMNLRTVMMTVISFYQVDHTYDRNFIIKHLAELKDLLQALVRPHLTDKSLGRIDIVLSFFSQVDFLDSIFTPNKNNETLRQMGVLVDNLNKCIEVGVL